MTVRSEPLITQPETKARRPRIGFLRPGHVEQAFIILLYLMLLLLVVLSVLGTFYGRLGENAPLTEPRRILSDISAAPGAFWVAVAVQIVLGLTQYGSRLMARHDRRWWILYLAALSISVYYNVLAYWAPLNDLTPWYIASVLIVAGDVLPELLAVRHD